MAMAEVRITCTCCGKEFKHRKAFATRGEADRYEAWAIDHIDTCPECYKEQKAAMTRQENAKVLAESGHTLPAITGASEKQVAFAEKVRDGWFAKYHDHVERIWLVQDSKLCPGYPIDRLRSQLGLSAEASDEDVFEAGKKAYMSKLMQQFIGKQAMVCATETNAGKIIDALR